MRVRKKKHAPERIEACSHLLIKDHKTLLNGPSSVFPKEQKVALEIGCGKGSFITQLCVKDPDTNYIAMEKIADVMVLALEKTSNVVKNTDNVRFLIGDAANLLEFIPEHSIDAIYINFCDPWKKARQAKRRLTFVSFLEIYRKILRPGGMLYFKTDNAPLFEFSLTQFEEAKLEIVWMTRDLHNSDKKDENLKTEYEINFSEKGFNINSAHVKFN